MFFRLLTSAVTLVVCSTAMAQAPLVSPAISYTRDIQPILTEKCVACHACNDAACQLNLGSAEGATRGASKVPVYKGDRVDAVAPRGSSTMPAAPLNGATKVFTRCLTPRARRRP